MARVTGIGGIFFKARDPDALKAWYDARLGVTTDRQESGATFRWRDAEDPAREGFTVWSVFPADTQYFGESDQPFMINYRVDDLDGLLASLRAAGVEIAGEIEEYEYGRFAWVYDPEGNRIELWEPAGR